MTKATENESYERNFIAFQTDNEAVTTLESSSRFRKLPDDAPGYVRKFMGPEAES